MMRMTISKIKKICSVALIPRILRDEFSLTPKKLAKRPLDGLWKRTKYTDSKNGQSDHEKCKCEKCRKIIEMVFGPENDGVVKNIESNLADKNKDKLTKVLAPTASMKDKSMENNKPVVDSLLSSNNTQTKLETIDSNLPSTLKTPSDKNTLENVIQFTTAKKNKDELAQKLETIDEPELIKARTPKIEGCDNPANVLPNHVFNLRNKNTLCTKIGPEEDALNEIAKKCIGSPPDKVDERIIEEMRSCGMLGRGRKKSISKRDRVSNDNSNKKEPLLESKSEDCTLSFEKLETPNRPLHSYPPVQCRYHRFHYGQENSVYSSYFRDAFGNTHSKPNYGHKNEEIDKNQQDTELLTHSAVKGYQKIYDQVCDHTAEKELIEQPELLKTEKQKEENPKVSIDLEKMSVTAGETLHLSNRNEMECKCNGSLKDIKPDILPYSQSRRKTLPTVDESFAPHDHPSYLSFAYPYYPTDMNLPLVPERPFNQPNTAISGTYPANNQNEREIKKDSAISSWQNPGEFYEFSQSNTGKISTYYTITPSTVRPLEAYHPYTIISETEKEEESRNTYMKKQETSEIINKEIPSTLGPLPEFKEKEEDVSMSEMLKRVRDKHRSEYCKEYVRKTVELEVEPTNKFIPTLKKKDGKTLGPDPCKPKRRRCPPPPPPPKCPPPPPPACPPPDPCKEKKDPCAKFTKINLVGDKIKEAFILVLQVGLRPPSILSTQSYDLHLNALEPLEHLLIFEDANRIEKLCSFLLNGPIKNKLLENENIRLMRDYEPWTPMPSWPIPKKEEKKGFVCPKEGCKYNPPLRNNPPCKEKPCRGFPKKSFSIIEFDFEPLYLNEDEF